MMDDNFVTKATFTGYVFNFLGAPALLYVTLQALIAAGKLLHRLCSWLCIRFSKRETCLFWYLHCSRYCVKQIANGLVLSNEWTGKDRIDKLLRDQDNAKEDLLAGQGKLLVGQDKLLAGQGTLLAGQGTLLAGQDKLLADARKDLEEKDNLLAGKDASEKKLQTELATLQGEVAEARAEARAGKKELLAKLLEEVRAAHFEERTS
jgi:hypothetical protein